MTALATRRAFTGASLKQTTQQHKASRTKLTVLAATKKVNVVDNKWNKGIGSVGYLLEDRERATPNMFRQLEKKKVLSSVEQLGLLSAAEKAGLSLSKIEQLGLLSTAERLGLLSLAENLLVSDPGKISSTSLPFVVGAVGAAVLIPHDNTLETVLSYTLAAVLLGVGSAFFIGGFVVKSLQDE